MGMILYGCLLWAAQGCDALYRLLHKEGAQERDLLGDVLSSEPNPKVQELQRLLGLYGYNPGTTDGKLGAKTRIAVEKFQKDNGLPAHRFVDKATWRQLHVFHESKLILHGELNVKMIQTALNNAGFPVGRADGRMGRQTQENHRPAAERQDLG